MANISAAATLATVIWVTFAFAVSFDLPRRSANYAWVVTSSDKLPTRPALARAHAPLQTAALRGI